VSSTLLKLMQEKAKIDARIRACRVTTIRRVLVHQPKIARYTRSKIEEMDKMLLEVHYCHKAFDDLLEQLECELGLNWIFHDDPAFDSKKNNT